MERKCELCPARAALFCEADQAYVCWECDSKVHGANFLVARHHRAVLCRRCSSPTLWRASGARFHPTSCLCPPCQSRVASTGSEKQSNENPTQSAVLSSANSSIQNLKRQGAAEKTAEYETSICTSVCQAKNKIARSSRSDLSNKRENCSFDVGRAPEDRPRSPVSVIFSRGKTLAKKRRTLIRERASVESSSDSTLEDSSDETDSRETVDSTRILELAFKWTESPLSPKISRRRQSMIRKQNRMPVRERQSFSPHLRTRDQSQLSSAEARTESVFWDWHDHMNLRSPATVSLAMRLFRKFSCIIEVSDMDRLDARIILACCLWIAIKLHNPKGAESRSQLYEECTGIPLRTMLAAEWRIFRVLNWRTVHEGCKDDMP